MPFYITSRGLSCFSDLLETLLYLSKHHPKTFDGVCYLICSSLTSNVLRVVLSQNCFGKSFFLNPGQLFYSFSFDLEIIRFHSTKWMVILTVRVTQTMKLIMMECRGES